MIFDIVLRSRTSGEGGHRAETDRVICGSQNLAQAVTGRTGILPVHEGMESAERGAGESRKDSGTYATAYYRFMQNFAKVKGKRDTKLRYVGKSHVACLLVMFT